MKDVEIILETVREYQDPTNRSLFYSHGTHKDAVAVYQASNGNLCAVSRCLNKHGLRRVGTSSKNLDAIFSFSFDRYLKEQYRGQLFTFWKNLQKLHDNHNFWSEDGITEAGKKFVLEKFKIDLDKHKI